MSKTISSSLAICIFIFGLVITTPANIKVLADQSQIYISEINYAGSVNDQNCKKDSIAKITCANDKWIEIYNAGSSEVNLMGWKIGVGKRKEDSTQFASTFSITTNTIIKPDSHFVLLNSDKNLLSTLDLAGVSYKSFGSLFGISNNTAGSKYLRVALLQNNQIINQRSIDNLDNLEKLNHITQSSYLKQSIYYTSADSEPAFSSISNQYFKGNAGSPGGFLASTNQTIQEINSPLVAAETIPQVSINPNSQPETGVVESMPIISSQPNIVPDSTPMTVSNEVKITTNPIQPEISDNIQSVVSTTNQILNESVSSTPVVSTINLGKQSDEVKSNIAQTQVLTNSQAIIYDPQDKTTTQDNVQITTTKQKAIDNPKQIYLPKSSSNSTFSNQIESNLGLNSSVSKGHIQNIAAPISSDSILNKLTITKSSQYSNIYLLSALILIFRFAFNIYTGYLDKIRVMELDKNIGFRI
jgi:hypothetical protein